MKNYLFIMAVLSVLAFGCSTNQKTDAADADSNRIDTSMSSQPVDGASDEGPMADTTSTNSADTLEKGGNPNM